MPRILITDQSSSWGMDVPDPDEPHDGWLWRPVAGRGPWHHRKALEGRTYPAGAEFAPLTAGGRHG